MSTNVSRLCMKSDTAGLMLILLKVTKLIILMMIIIMPNIDTNWIVLV